MRHRPEQPRSFIEYLLAYEGENLDAEILADVYNPKRPGFFMAFINGKRFNDLRFVVRPRGALRGGEGVGAAEQLVEGARRGGRRRGERADDDAEEDEAPQAQEDLGAGLHRPAAPPRRISPTLK
jgi:hypothetical protein